MHKFFKKENHKPVNLSGLLSTMDLIENEDGTIQFKGLTLEAFAYNEETYNKENLFHKCGFLLLCSYDYDADFCAACNVWVTPKCEDPYCNYCSKRPEKPLPDLHATYNESD